MPIKFGGMISFLSGPLGLSQYYQQKLAKFLQNNTPPLLNVLQKSNYLQMRHEKHRDCSHALEEDAPKAWGHGSYSKWVKGATERRTPWSGGVHRNGGNKKITQELGTAYVGIQGEGVKQQFNHINSMKDKTMVLLCCCLAVVATISLPPPSSPSSPLPSLI